MEENLKIQFGCGGNKLEGFQNFDIELDVTKPPYPFRDGSAKFIFSEHMLEHCEGPDFLRFLDECIRILKPGGSIRLCMPVIHQRLKREHARDLILGHGHLAAYTPELIETFLWAAGFRSINQTGRLDIDGHWKTIGQSLDDIETFRVEAIRP